MSPFVILDAVVFLALAVHIAVRAVRTGQTSLRRLAWFVGAIGVVAAMIPLVGENGESWPAVVTMLGVLALYPPLLLYLGASLAPEARPLERLAGVALAVEAVALAVTPFVLADPLDALYADMGIVAVVAGLAHLAVHVVLERQVRTLASSFVRRRARALQAGLLLLAVALVGGVFIESYEAAALLAGGAAALLSAATAPPRWLQMAFAQPDYERLLAAEEAIATATDPGDAVGELLEGLRRLVTGRAAWLDRDGGVVAAVGEDPATFATVETPEPVEGPRPVLAGDGTSLWLLEATAPSVRLCVVTGRDPVLYGLHDADLLPRTARRVAVALQGRELEANRRAQERAEQDAEHFRRVAALKDDLLATINHELRTPLQMVGGALELAVARWDEVDEDQRRLLVQRADVNAQALSGVVLDVLALAELRTGMTRPLPTATELASVVDEGLAGLDGDGRVEVVCPLAELVVDPRLTARVLGELVDNALTHTDGAVRVELQVDDHDLRMLVHDTGPGLSADLLAPFERAGHYLHRTTRGLGLGLSLVVETIQVLGGEVEIDGDGSGTTVACRVPHAGATHATATPAAAVPQVHAD